MGSPTERSALLSRVAQQQHDDTEQESNWMRRTITKSFGRVGQRTRVTLSVVGVVAAFIGVLVVAVVVIHNHSPQAAMGATPLEYDAIVIGGGPAGSVVSKLLSDDPWRRVLLIEAGDASQVDLGGKARINSDLNREHLTPFDVPYYWTNVANTQSYHWDYPDVNVAKALGGCGIHNAMLYVRALPSDLEGWAMKKWTWKKALQIYMRMEDYDGPNTTTFHGKTGIVRTSPPSCPDELSEKFVEACEEIGIPRTADFNAPHGRYGAGFYHFNTRDGVRESAARRFLGPILKERRPNFYLSLNTTVHKVNINEALTAATGVDVEYDDGRRETIRLATHGKVIVTAGAINTPKVLMQSGLGHGDDLNRLGLPVKKHLPRVGMNLQDHPVLAMTFESPTARNLDLKAALETYFQATQRKDANVTSYGMMGGAGISAGAFLIPPGSTIPEIQLTFFPRSSEPHVANSSELDHRPEVLITVALLHPTARNRIYLEKNHKNEFIPRVVSEVPEQEAEHLREDDVWKLSWGITVVRSIAATLARRGLLGAEISPGPSISTMAALNKWVPDAVFRNSHWVGSAAMGHSPEDGVIDNHLRVFGIHNLRVADASVIPRIPNGNVHSSVLMVASHAVELIREEETLHPRNTTS